MNSAYTDRSQNWSFDPLTTMILRLSSGRVGLVLSLVSSIGLLGCGGSSSSNTSISGGALSGNWQFTLKAPQDGSFSGGLQGGFLLQQNGSIKGQVVYSISVAVAGSPPMPCDGSAAISGTVSGQNVTLTAAAASQTITLSGTLSSDGSTITGTYATVATQNCGTAQTGLQWTATLVPPLNGAVQGTIHSSANGSPAANQEYAITGFLSQGTNSGANNATVTGTLNFQGYPCLDTASVNGQISGSSVVLQLVAANGLNVGQIGTTIGSPSSPTNAGPVTFQSSTGGYVLLGNTGYGVSTKACPSGGTAPADSGYICLGLGSSTACAQPLSLTPALLTFPAQPVGSPATSQTIKLTNPSASDALNNLQVLLPFSPSDFDGVPNFTEQDNCSSIAGSTFSLAPQKSCIITISFSPQQSCLWLPSAVSGLPFAAPSQCPPFVPVRPIQLTSPPALAGTLRVECPSCQTMTNDSNALFVVPITGIGISAIQPSTPELDFGPEDASLNEVSSPQSITLTNQGASSVQILPAMATPPCGNPGTPVSLLRPSTPGTVPGIQVVTGSISPFSSSIQYVCDVDITSLKPNFEIVSDDCSGTLLTPQQSCSLAIAYAPQPVESAGGLNYFLQLNTLQCTSTTTTDCEIDSGRFPVELKSALASPLRVLPGAGLNFGTWPNGQTSYPPLSITLSNDNRIATPQAITFQAIVPKGDYVETDNCGVSLAPGSSCTMTISFAPKVTGFDPGSITITYNNTLSQVISLWGFGQ